MVGGNYEPALKTRKRWHKVYFPSQVRLAEKKAWLKLMYCNSGNTMHFSFFTMMFSLPSQKIIMLKCKNSFMRTVLLLPRN